SPGRGLRKSQAYDPCLSSFVAAVLSARKDGPLLLACCNRLLTKPTVFVIFAFSASAKVLDLSRRSAEALRCHAPPPRQRAAGIVGGNGLVDALSRGRRRLFQRPDASRRTARSDPSVLGELDAARVRRYAHRQRSR